MSFRLLMILSISCMVGSMMGCDNKSSVDKLQDCFDELKAATDAFYNQMSEITDVETAESNLAELEATHKRLAIASHELDLAEQTSSRAARNLKREIQDYKKEQRSRLKTEFERLKSDKFVKAVMEPFLHRINAF